MKLTRQQKRKRHQRKERREVTDSFHQAATSHRYAVHALNLLEKTARKADASNLSPAACKYLLDSIIELCQSHRRTIDVLADNQKLLRNLQAQFDELAETDLAS